MKNTVYMSLLISTILLAGPADGPSIGGNISNSSENKGTIISIGGAKMKQSNAVSNQKYQVGSTQGTQTDIGNIKIKSGKVTNSVTNNSRNKDLILNIGSKVQKGSIDMTKGSAGSISNSSKNEGSIVSMGGGNVSLDTAGMSSTDAKIGSSENTETNVGAVNIDGGTVTGDISNTTKNSKTVVNIGGVVNKGTIKVKDGQAKSILNSSENTGTIVNIGGAKLSTKSLGGMSEMDLEVGSQNTQTDVGSVELNSGLVKGNIQNSSKNSATLINVGSTLKVGSIEIGK